MFSSFFSSEEDRICYLWKVQNVSFSVISKQGSMLYKTSTYHFFQNWKIIFFWFLKYHKRFVNTIFLPTSCVGKGLLLLPETHNIKFFFIQKIHGINFPFLLNMYFRFMKSCFCNNLVPFKHFKVKKLNLHYQGKCETELRNFFFSDFSMVTACNMPILVPSKIPWSRIWYFSFEEIKTKTSVF